MTRIANKQYPQIQPVRHQSLVRKLLLIENVSKHPSSLDTMKARQRGKPSFILWVGDIAREHKVFESYLGINSWTVIPTSLEMANYPKWLSSLLGSVLFFMEIMSRNTCNHVNWSTMVTPILWRIVLFPFGSSLRKYALINNWLNQSAFEVLHSCLLLLILMS